MQTLQQMVELVRYLAEGETSAMIAKRFNVSSKTIEMRIAEIKSDYEAKSTTHLVHIFHQRKLIK